MQLDPKTVRKCVTVNVLADSKNNSAKMEEDVLNTTTSVLRSRFVYMPGGYDKNGNVLVVINLIALNDYPANYLDIYVDYLKKSLW